MDDKLHIRLLTEERFNKVRQMVNMGYHIPNLVRNFIDEFPLEKNTEKAS